MQLLIEQAKEDAEKEKQEAEQETEEESEEEYSENSADDQNKNNQLKDSQDTEPNNNKQAQDDRRDEAIEGQTDKLGFSFLKREVDSPEPQEYISLPLRVQEKASALVVAGNGIADSGGSTALAQEKASALVVAGNGIADSEGSAALARNKTGATAIPTLQSATPPRQNAEGLPFTSPASLPSPAGVLTPARPTSVHLEVPERMEGETYNEAMYRKWMMEWFDGHKEHPVIQTLAHKLVNLSFIELLEMDSESWTQMVKGDENAVLSIEAFLRGFRIINITQQNGR